MSDKIAVIGDHDLIFPLRVLGIQVHSPKSLQEAREILSRLQDEKAALCLIHESFYEPLSGEIEELRRSFTPVVVGFSDYRTVTDYLGEIMREMAVKATGSDSLVKQRGEDETR